jgi:uncharacterized SAM-binding protein YcdF (DUF218 family)
MTIHLHVLAEKIWQYHLMNHQLFQADVILVLCSHDTRVAERGAELFHEGWAPLVIFSGGLGTITKDIWTEPEANQFAKVAIRLGVPEEKILIENKSSNTGENILFTRQLLAQKDIDPQKFILVQKPYMERRSFATFRKLWPDKEVAVTSPQVTFNEYLDSYASRELSRDEVISIMIGDLQRIKLYPEKGFQIYQEIPDDVWAAYEVLVQAGYKQRLIAREG